MSATRVNDLYLPGFRLPQNVQVVTDLEHALAAAEIVLSVVPSHLVRDLYTRMLPYLDPAMLFVSATKGLENGSLLRVSEVIGEVAAARFEPRVTVISGPTFAREVAGGVPTALVVASNDDEAARLIQAAFSGPTFRLYTSPDPVGVEIGAAVKNVVAIGAGVCHGLGLGSNAMAALITRGLAEITRLAMALGGRQQTLAGLAGLGDLVLTCTGDLSRNRTVGLELARGRSLDEIVNSMNMVAEGINSTKATFELAGRFAVEMPITSQMFQMLNFGLAPREAIRRLMERTLKEE
jgi:glycerol-3-phosphate dehydrogenase (NAD(P)+)